MNLPIACTLDGADLASRRQRWSRLIDGFSIGRAETPRGIELSFRADPGVAAELQELAALERECCGFATWSVREGDEGEAVELRVEADGEGAAAIQRMFSEA